MTKNSKIGLGIAAGLVSCFLAGAEPLKDGVYPGAAGGHGGPVQVAVIVLKGRIYRVEVGRHKEKNQKAMDTVAQRIIAKQSVEVDAVTGATISSKAVMNAVKNALEQAH